MAWAWIGNLRRKAVEVAAPAEPDHVEELVIKVMGLMKAEPLTWTKFIRRLQYKPSVIEEPLITVHDCEDQGSVYMEILRHDGKKEEVKIASDRLRGDLIAACKKLDYWIAQAQAEACIKNIDTYISCVDLAAQVGSHEFPHSAAKNRGK